MCTDSLTRHCQDWYLCWSTGDSKLSLPLFANIWSLSHKKVNPLFSEKWQKLKAAWFIRWGGETLFIYRLLWNGAKVAVSDQGHPISFLSVGCQKTRHCPVITSCINFMGVWWMGKQHLNCTGGIACDSLVGFSPLPLITVMFFSGKWKETKQQPLSRTTGSLRMWLFMKAEHFPEDCVNHESGYCYVWNPFF